MRNLKKALALVVVFAMMLSTVAFAAPSLTSDIENQDVKEAVARLAAFGIVAGKEDGLYHPDEELTREQFAKLVVEALGLGEAAEAGKGSSMFSDVQPDRWSAGYINVAAGQGIVKGTGDGLFSPEAPVTYPEAVTMLVRALGYKDEFLPGAWPANYVAKAADLNITDKVRYSVRGTVDRGSAALMVDNTLDAKVVKVDTYEGSVAKFYESEKTLLEDKLEIVKAENTRIIANKRVDDGLNEDEARVLFLKDVKDSLGIRLYDEGDIKDLEVVEDGIVEPFLGEEVTIYLNDDDEIIYVESEKDDQAKYDYVEAVKTVKTDGNGEGVIEVSLVAFDDDYELADDAYVYVLDSNKYSNKATTRSSGDNYIDVDRSGDILGHVGKFVIKNNKIVYAEIIEGGETAPWALVTDNKDGFIKGINETDESFDIDLTDDGNYDGTIVLDTEGNVLTVDDIEEGNIIYVQKQSYDGDDYAVVRVVKDNVVEGELGRVKDDRIEIGGKEIKVVKYADGSNTYYQAFYSIDNNENAEYWKGSKWADDMEDADGADLVAYLDAAGRIAYVTTEAEATSGYMYGIVTKVFNESEKVKVYTMTADGDGDEITYALEDADYVNVNGVDVIAAARLNEYGQKLASYNATEPLAVGDVIKFKLNNNGEIAEDEIYVATTTWKLQANEDFGKDSIPAMYVTKNGTEKNVNFAVGRNITIIDGEDADSGEDYTDNFGVIAWEDIAEKDYDSEFKFYVFADDDNEIDLEGLVFVGKKGADATDDEEAIYVIDKWSRGGDDYIEFVSFDGSIEEMEVDSGLGKDERPYIAERKSDGKIELYTDSKGDFNFVAGVIYAKDGDVLTVKTSANSYSKYKLSGETVVYEEDDKKSTSNLRVDDAIYMVVENDVNVRVVERLVDSEATYVKKNFTKPYGD
ncbi:MAG: hypothetical protein PWQ70_1701 [Clostridiales bacterium]|nr:hypothetical protein [Clostridiales bacterium]